MKIEFHRSDLNAWNTSVGVITFFKKQEMLTSVYYYKIYMPSS